MPNYLFATRTPDRDLTLSRKLSPERSATLDRITAMVRRYSLGLDGDGDIPAWEAAENALGGRL